MSKITIEQMTDYVSQYLQDCTLNTAVDLLSNILNLDIQITHSHPFDEEGEGSPIHNQIMLIDGRFIHEEGFADYLGEMIDNLPVDSMLALYSEIKSEDYTLSDDNEVVLLLKG